ncbi:MAG: hypothetical protein IPL02_05540 [Moraxellaceae bacterium]|nr:hypothetical protein [Moraxellaceae bacterium]
MRHSRPPDAATITPQQTLRELDFHLPLQRFYPPQLIDCLRKHGLTVPDLMAQNITGFMKALSI